jgi:hypothetical protein
MNAGRILETTNQCNVAFILIGGMNFTQSVNSSIRKSSKRIQCSASGGPL